MNWEFRAATTKDVPQMIDLYGRIAAEVIEDWIEKFESEKEVQPESSFAEKPTGFYAEGPWYNFRFRMYGPKGAIGPPEFDIKVEQTFYPAPSEPMPGTRVRRIERVEAIS